MLVPNGVTALLMAPLLAPRLPAANMQVKQASQIEVGQPMPAGYIEIVTDGCAADDSCAVLTVDEFLGKGKCVLVGMPGAFTPTCTDEHLPGYIRSAKRFKRLGVKKIAVITTNDRFIMSAWKKAMKECMDQEGLRSIDSEIDMLSDDKGELVKSLGLAFNMAPEKKSAWSFQLNAGLRSKRFAVVIDEGVVSHIAVDEGSTEMDGTSAESILDVLKPGAGSNPGTDLVDEPLLPVVGLLAAAAAYAFYTGAIPGV